jgi:DtxR family Mn-dependent transcriptional regulator
MGSVSGNDQENERQLMMLSSTEENYIKAIFKLSGREKSSVSTNAIAENLQTSAASVTDMIKRLAEKKYVKYAKYKGTRLTPSGEQVATTLIRKHRLWEVFLVDKLSFTWDEVHEIAEELEHIQSKLLVERLDAFLDFPKVDPHGDPIPDAQGNFADQQKVPLSELDAGEEGVIIGVNDTSSEFLQHLDRIGVGLGTAIKVLEKVDYDDSRVIQVNGESERAISNMVSQNLLVKSSG